jgi:hypothetical protein
LETVAVALERRCERCRGILGPSRADRRFCATACRMAAYRAWTRFYASDYGKAQRDEARERMLQAGFGIASS